MKSRAAFLLIAELAILLLVANTFSAEVPHAATLSMIVVPFSMIVRHLQRYSHAFPLDSNRLFFLSSLTVARGFSPMHLSPCVCARSTGRSPSFRRL